MKFKQVIILILIINNLSTVNAEIPEPIAITSFTNHSGDKKYEWFDEAFANMLTTDFASIKKISVVNRVALKNILKEQSLSLSGITDENSSVEIGQLVGAKSIITGSFVVIGNEVRVDAQIYSVETGVAIGAAAVEGKMNDIFNLEEQLVIKLFDVLSIELTDEQKNTILKKETENIIAVENNYRGVVAEDDSQIELAVNFYKKAVQADPKYKNAYKNLERASKQLEGKKLFSNALSELGEKEQQLDTIKYLFNEFENSYYKFYITDDINIVTNTNNPDVADILIKFHVNIDKNAIIQLLNNLESISAGDCEILFSVGGLETIESPKKSGGIKKILEILGELISINQRENNKSYTLFLYEENYKWFKSKYEWDGRGAGYVCELWFEKLKIIQLKANEEIVAKKEIVVAVVRDWRLGNYPLDIVNPKITCWDSIIGLDNAEEGLSPLEVTVLIPEININKIREIDNVEIVNP